MKTLLTVIAAMIFLGCSDNQTSEDNPLAPLMETTIGNVREYNPYNSENRINIFISIGQSNAKGIATQADMNVSGVFMPKENIALYPDEIVLEQFRRKGVNKAIVESTYINTTTKFAKDYNSTIPLIAINIAVGGTGINTGSRVNNLWSTTRADNDGKSLHPQTIHYLETLFNQLQDEGKEPYVIGLDWNQWENENRIDTAYAYLDTYSYFFKTFESVIPNRDFKLFICRPTSIAVSHTETIAQSFELLKQNRGNTYIYNPAELGTDIWRDESKVHYTEEIHYQFAQYILDNI